MKKILIAIPTAKYIKNEVFTSLWDLDEPEGYKLDFQYFYGYSRSQILNLACEWGKNYDAFLLVNKNIMLEKNTIIDCVNEGVDLISIDDNKSIFVSSDILRKMKYPHFTSEETEIVERQKFIKSAQDIGASYKHIIGKTKTVSYAII